jgi:transcriptional regulator with XRE-family HTH domain
MPYQKTHINNQLKNYRKKYRLRQKDVANILGFKIEDRVSHWENGSSVPGLHNLFRLCVLYEVSLSDLYPELYKEIKEIIIERIEETFASSFADTKNVGDRPC